MHRRVESTAFYIWTNVLFRSISQNNIVFQDKDTLYLGEILYGLCEGDLSLHHVELSQVAPALGVLCTKRWPKCVDSRKSPEENEWQGVMKKMSSHSVCARLSLTLGGTVQNGYVDVKTCRRSAQDHFISFISPWHHFQMKLTRHRQESRDGEKVLVFVHLWAWWLCESRGFKQCHSLLCSHQSRDWWSHVKPQHTGFKALILGTTTVDSNLDIEELPGPFTVIWGDDWSMNLDKAIFLENR